MDWQGVPIIHEVKTVTWRMKLDSHFLSLDENIFLSLEYGIKDEFNDKSKYLTLHGIS